MDSGLANDKADSVQSEAKVMSSELIAATPQISRQNNRDTSSSRPNPPESSEASLLGIPSELRNLIYRHALLQETMIQVSPTNPSQPALLLINRQIRSEALPIWLTENSFKVDAWDMQLTIPANYHVHWLSRVAHKNFFITMRGKKNWENLKGWLGRYARHEVPGLAVGQPTDETEILAQAFEMVYCLLGRCESEQMGGALAAWIRTVELAGVEFDFQ